MPADAQTGSFPERESERSSRTPDESSTGASGRNTLFGVGLPSPPRPRPNRIVRPDLAQIRGEGTLLQPRSLACVRSDIVARAIRCPDSLLLAGSRRFCALCSTVCGGDACFAQG